MTQPELLTVLELAERLHVRPRTVQTWARQGRIPAVKLSAKVVRFDWQAVLAAIRSRARRQKPDRSSGLSAPTGRDQA
jgi:excisionase family DNA binding protein